jgi:hypothetical protein
MTSKLTRQVIRLTLPFAALLCAIIATSTPAPAQQPAATNPFAGEWSLEFHVVTPPGGATMTVPNDTQHVNLLLQVSREEFTVAADGALRWEQRDEGHLHWDNTSSLIGSTWVQDQTPVLRVVGQATATPARAGAAHTYDRQLTLDLAWTGGNGSGIGHAGPPWVVSISADGSTWTTLGHNKAVPYEKSQFDLRPANVQREELAPDVIRETTTYRGSRQRGTIDFTAPYSVSITERIEIKHVHYLDLVPRG